MLTLFFDVSSDDWPPFQAKAAIGAGFIDPHHIERFWKEQFEYCYAEYEEGFVFPISIHPQVSGKPQVLMMHDRLIEFINSHAGVEWVTFEEMSDRFKNGQFHGVTVEGGVE